MSICDVDAGHMLGRVHSYDSFSAVDGPGTRCVVFLQGCMFRCQYCQNRDTWDMEQGELYTVCELVTELVPYKPFLTASGGGVTVTGGEPLLQMEFVRELFRGLHMEGIHTALDTNGYIASPHYDESLEGLLEHCDLVMLDIKHMDSKQHERVTGLPNEHVLQFARYLEKRKQAAWIRYVVVPGLTDQLDNARRLAEFLVGMNNIERVELLPYHTLGVHKWEALGHRYPLHGTEPPTRECLEALAEPLRDAGLLVSLC